VVQGTLRDGCKIAVFSATFVTQDNADGVSTTCMRLSYNGVRRAEASARQGYVPPEHLLRGISLRSITPGSIPCQHQWSAVGTTSQMSP
jgi:hypothetical protein